MKAKSVSNQRIFLVLILLAIFVVPSSISGTAIALPAIAVDTGAVLTRLQWVVNAFNLSFACLTLPWGALADKLGRRRCFLVGVALYSLASFVSAIAPNALILDIGRALAGAGAAAVFSCGIALLSTNFDGSARLRVFALFGTVAGLGVSLGPTIAGTLLDASGWRSIFYLHAAILAAVLAGHRAIPVDESSAVSRLRFDFAGATLFISGFFALLVAIVQSSQWGWVDLRTVTLLMLSVALFLFFWYVERRHSTPMFDLSLLANARFVGYSLITVAGSFGFVTLLTYFPSYATAALNMSATRAGLTMLLLTAPMLVCPMAAGKMVAKGFSSSLVLMASLFCLLAGVVGLALISQPQVQVTLIAVPLLLVGAGYGLAAGLVDGLALQTVPERKAGMAAGLLNTFRLGSEAIAVSLYGSTLATLLHAEVQLPLSKLVSSAASIKKWADDAAAGNLYAQIPFGANLSPEELKQILVQGYDSAFHTVLWLIFAVVLALTLVIRFLIRDARKSAQNVGTEMS